MPGVKDRDVQPGDDRLAHAAQTVPTVRGQVRPFTATIKAHPAHLRPRGTTVLWSA
jgi:hypothetical protein